MQLIPQKRQRVKTYIYLNLKFHNYSRFLTASRSNFLLLSLDFFVAVQRGEGDVQKGGEVDTLYHYVI